MGLSKKQIKKLIDKECYFCGCNEYVLLDSHRILPGSEGGKYTDFNSVTLCCACHRKLHAGLIKIVGRYMCSLGRSVIIYIDENGQEQIK